MQLPNQFKLNKYHKLVILLVLLFISGQVVFAQDIKIIIKVVSENRISIKGKFLDEKKSFKQWSFIQNYADVTNLAERIEQFQLFDENGNRIETKKLIVGEYLASKEPKSWSYEANLTPSAKITDSAHSSWLTKNHGLLMLADLFPQLNKTSAEVNFEVPNNWQVFSTEKNTQSNTFLLNEIDSSVFLIGKDLRENKVQIDKTLFSLVSTGEWKFSDDEGLDQVQTIINEYRKTIGSLPNWKTNIIILPFPQENPNHDRWRAETRGSTVTIISGQLPHKNLAIQRLNEQLRHEIFHLWMPNSLALSGNYDWFYEGFSVYHALRTGVELNQIRFDDFLTTISQAYRISDFLIAENGQNLSLIEASNNRWTGLTNVIYAKGLVVAFLCDISLLKESKGKKNLKDVFRSIYEKHRKSQPKSSFNLNEIVDGNTAILSVLKSFPELNLVVKNFIEGKEKITWQSDLAVFGLIFEERKLKVIENPNGRQKDLLDKLGYNQWRKLLQKTK